MEIPIVVEPTGDNGFRASSGGLWGLEIEAPTREEAVARLRELIDRRLESGAEVVGLEIRSQPHPRPAVPRSRLKVGQLNAFLEGLPKLGEDADAFLEDIRAIRRELPPEPDPWA